MQLCLVEPGGSAGEVTVSGVQPGAQVGRGDVWGWGTPAFLQEKLNW